MLLHTIEEWDSGTYYDRHERFVFGRDGVKTVNRRLDGWSKVGLGMTLIERIAPR